MKIALAMIVKDSDDEAVHLDRCLKSAFPYVDGVFVNLNRKAGVKHSDKVWEVLQKYDGKLTLIETEWVGDFVAARQASFAMVPKDYGWILWLDTDDTLKGGKQLRSLCKEATKLDGVYLDYEYAHDEYGNITDIHAVARLVKNNGVFDWKSSFNDIGVSVHETLVERRQAKAVMNKEVVVVHHSDEERRDRSLYRNIELLEKMLENHKSNPDARILFYLATHYMDARKYAEARKLFEAYVKVSGWGEERSQAYVYLAQLSKEPEKKRDYLLKALYENPADPAPYIELGEQAYNDRLFDRSVLWLELAVSLKQQNTSIVRRPMNNTFRAYMLLAQSRLNLGGNSINIAEKWVEKAAELRPHDPDVINAKKLIKGLKRVKDKTDAVKAHLKVLIDKKSSRNTITKYLQSLGEDMQDNPLIAAARKEFSDPKKWPKKSIAIFCGAGPLGIWGPWSLKEGTGGSEEAVIRLSRQLKNLGWEVTVFATPGDKAGVYDGVSWQPYWLFDDRDEFDVLVAWRCPWFFDKKYNARKSYLWLHDVMDKEEFFEERWNNLDKVILLSKYHRTCYPMIPDDKIFLSANGIDPEDFEKFDNVERDPHRMIYTSSHVRGLDLIYTIWPDVKEEVPEATLDVYYGWGSFDAIHRNNPERMAWKQKIISLTDKLDGVADHGKVGQDVIAEEMSKSGIWVYPCPFPEISCITAMKAQASGAIPVSSNFAALEETVQYGVKIPMKAMDEKTPVGKWDKEELDKFKGHLVSMLKNPSGQEAIRSEMKKWARENQSWSNVAGEWDEEFNS